MFSNKIYSLFDFMSKLCQRFDTVTLIFNSKIQQFYVSTNPKLGQRVAMHYLTTIIWGCASFALLLKHEQHMHQVYLTLLYWLSLFIAVVIYSITRWFPSDTCRMANGLNTFLKYFQSTMIRSLIFFEKVECKY